MSGVLTLPGGPRRRKHTVLALRAHRSRPARPGNGARPSCGLAEPTSAHSPAGDSRAFSPPHATGNGSTRASVGDAGERPRVRPDEARIIAHVHARQHRRAVEHAARAFGPELHRFFARWYPSEAEDLVQEVLVRVYEAFRRDRFQAHMGFTGWLFKIATNLRRDHHRKTRRRGDLLKMHAQTIMRDLHGAGVGQSTWDSLTRQEQRCWLDQAIRSLPDDEQELLALRYDAALPWTEVARALGVRISTAKLKFTQLRRVLVERWERP